MITPPTSVNEGPIPSSSSGCSIGKGGSGIGTDSHLQKPTRQRYSLRLHRAAKYRVSPNNDTPDQVKDVREGLALEIRDSLALFQSLGSDWALRCPN